MFRRISLFVLIAILAHSSAGAQTTQAKRRELVNSLFTRMSPDLPENSYLPDLVKTKLRWILSENQSKPSRLTITATDRWLDGNTFVLASTNNQPGKIPTITICAEALASRAQVLKPEVLKDVFLLSLAHEAIHLETQLKTESPDEVLAEEIRTWRKWIIGAVRPMLVKGKPVLADWALANQTLVSCDNKPDCMAFSEVVRQHLPKK